MKQIFKFFQKLLDMSWNFRDCLQTYELIVVAVRIDENVILKMTPTISVGTSGNSSVKKVDLYNKGVR